MNPSSPLPLTHATMPKKTLFVIDAYNLIYRMFYAIPEITTRDGKPVNAIFWVAKFLHALAVENPHAAMVVANDVGQNFREKLYTEYKAQRDRMPDNLKSQIQGVFSLFEAAGIQILFEDGFEADDIIGSLAHQHENNEYQVVIVSSDKDLCQFVKDGHIHIFDAMKRKFMKESDVLEKFGVPTHQVRDYLAIVGDASDNIPGIRGFGPKKAVDLLGKYGSLEGIYGSIGELPAKMQEILALEKENAFLSQKLATIVTDLQIEPFLQDWFSSGLGKPEYMELLRMYEFRSLLPRDETIKPKNTEKIDSHEIATHEELLSFQKKLIQNSSKSPSLVLSTDIYGKIFLGYGDEILLVDSRKIDASEFAAALLETEVELVGFDLKADIKRLYAIKNPLEKHLEGQGSLF